MNAPKHQFRVSKATLCSKQRNDMLSVTQVPMHQSSAFAGEK